MAQKIKQADIFGRVGTSIGKSLAEEIPKEVDRYRLASGLSQFERDAENLNPMQQVARLAAIPGMTPGYLQSFADLAKMQNRARAYQAAAGQQPVLDEKPTAGAGQEVAREKKERLVDRAIRASDKMQDAMKEPSGPGYYKEPSQYQQQPQLVPQNPADERMLARTPWNPEKRNATIAAYINRGFLPEEARELARDDEERDLAEPGALEKAYEQRRNRKAEALEEFNKKLELKLQKKPAKSGEKGTVFEDITGPMINNMQRGIERDLIMHPNASLEDITDEWSNRALNMAKAKNQFLKTAKTTGLETFFKGDQYLNKLQDYGNIYRKANNEEEYYDLLIEHVGLSPQGAATIAFERSKPVKEYINKFKVPVNFKTFGAVDLEAIENASRKAAIEIENLIQDKDSLLAIARELRKKDSNFIEKAFFDQLRQGEGKTRFNDRQLRELAEGESDITFTYGDVKVFPWLKR